MMNRSEVKRYLRDRSETLAIARSDDKKMTIATQTALTTSDSPKSVESPRHSVTMGVQFSQQVSKNTRSTEADPFGTAGDPDPFRGGDTLPPSLPPSPSPPSPSTPS